MSREPYVLPVLIAERYVLNTVMRETRDTIIYGAVQRDLQRDVLVESLRPEVMDDPERVRFFLDTARIQANVDDPSMGCSLELFFADDRWHYAKERIKGESLDEFVVNGSKLTASSMCDLLIQLCRSCIYMDMLGVDNAPFSLSSVFRVGSTFRYDNLVIAGERPRMATRSFLTAAVSALLPLLDESSTLATNLVRLMNYTQFNANWTHLEPLHLDEHLTWIQQLIMRKAMQS